MRFIFPPIAAALFSFCALAQTPAATAAPDPQPSTTPPATAAPPAPAAASPFTKWGTDFSFWFDGYADANFNHPDSGFNDLRFFDERADTVHLNLAKIQIDHAPAPVGFHLDLGIGESLYAIHATDPGPDGMKYVQQAFVSFKPKEWKGVEVDFGKFMSSAGAEAFEAYSSFNYSRSLLYALAEPFYHMGLRVSFPVGSHFTGGVQLVNGWNNDRDNNSGKTVGLTGAYAWKRVTWTNTYYGGPEQPRTNKGIRNLYDGIVQFNQNDNVSYYVNYDWGRENNLSGGGGKVWNGIAFAGRRQLKNGFAVAGRFEFYDDNGGFTTGIAQKVKEVTFTGEYRLNKYLLSRLELRDDWSDQDFFSQSGGKLGKNQTTVALALLAFFGPKK